MKKFLLAAFCLLAVGLATPSTAQAAGRYVYVVDQWGRGGYVYVYDFGRRDYAPQRVQPRPLPPSLQGRFGNYGHYYHQPQYQPRQYRSHGGGYRGYRGGGIRFGIGVGW